MSVRAARRERNGKTMTAEENAALVRQSLDAFNTRDFPSLRSVPVADDVEIHDLPRGIISHGAKGFDQFHQDLHNAFPNSRMTITNVQATDNQVFVEFSCPDAENLGRLGILRGTGRTISLDFAGVYEIDAGRITRVRFYYDGGSLMHQLGFRFATPESPRN
jgi:steroid delta-isomerase-like uncharacterized protein